MTKKFDINEIENILSPLYSYDMFAMLKIISSTSINELGSFDPQKIIKTTFPHHYARENNVEKFIRDCKKSELKSLKADIPKITTKTMPLTYLELKWLKLVINDPKARLFLSQEKIDHISELLKDIPELYDSAAMEIQDGEKQPDSFSSPEYIENFQTIYSALNNRGILEINYRTNNSDSLITGLYLPLRMEYDFQFNIFRLICLPFPDEQSSENTEQNKDNMIMTFNLRNIINVKKSGKIISMEKKREIIEHCVVPEKTIDITIKISYAKNTLERFMLMFAYYSKDLKKVTDDSCTVTMTIPENDLSNVIINILRFGITVQVLSPDPVIEKIREKLLKQKRLLEQDQQ